MLLWFGHGCCGDRMLSEHECYYGLGLAVVVTVLSRNMTVIMAWAWMLWSSVAVEHECYYGLGMDAVVTVCSWNMNFVMVWKGLGRLVPAEPNNYQFISRSV